MSIPNSTPHGGKLINHLVDEKRATILKELAFNLPDITLNERQMCDLELLAIGAFSPLQGFMCRSDYESVLDRMRLQNDLLFPLPVCLDISNLKAKTLEAGQSVTLRDPEGFLLAVMHIEEMWPVERDNEAKKIYGTLDKDHQGVHYLYTSINDVYVGGKLEVLSLPLHFDFKQLRLSPQETRSAFTRLGWKRVVGFQSRHPIQRLQFEMTMQAMRAAKANILIHPVVGMTKPGDFDHYTRVRCHKAITRQYPPDSLLLNLLPYAMRMAGPKEALLNTIVSKNYGCAHFIVGRDHASPGKNGRLGTYYGSDAATSLSIDFSKELDIHIVPFEEWVYLPTEDEYQTIDRVPEDVQTVSLSGADIQQRIRSGKRIPSWATLPSVMEVLKSSYPPPGKQGFAVFMTGLSGSGKSTVAKVLLSYFQEIGGRPVTLLDGDIVRLNLSSELNFSKEDRNTNVKRIGFVAGEIVKNRGIAICAPIAPYEDTRRQIRELIEAHGKFVEVHVSTSIEVCEKRDRKGMYAKARAGLIKEFTGVDDPYEVPKNPEVRIDTEDTQPDEAAQEVLLFLGQKGYI